MDPKPFSLFSSPSSTKIYSIKLCLVLPKTNYCGSQKAKTQSQQNSCRGRAHTHCFCLKLSFWHCHGAQLTGERNSGVRKSESLLEECKSVELSLEKVTIERTDLIENRRDLASQIAMT